MQTLVVHAVEQHILLPCCLQFESFTVLTHAAVNAMTLDLAVKPCNVGVFCSQLRHCSAPSLSRRPLASVKHARVCSARGAPY